MKKVILLMCLYGVATVAEVTPKDFLYRAELDPVPSIGELARIERKGQSLNFDFSTLLFTRRSV